MRSVFGFLLIVFCSVNIFAQEDTAKVLPTYTHIDSTRLNESIENPYGLDSKEIESMPARQMNDLMIQMPGVNIRDYGGYGGVKTFSLRGLGAQHSGVVLNGVPQPLANGGVADISSIPIENISTAELHVDDPGEELLPATAYRYAHTLTLTDALNEFTPAKFNMKTNLEAGSFDHYLGAYQFRCRPKKRYQIGGFVKYVNNSGNYPYKYRLGDKTISAFRKNTQYQNIQARVTQLIQLNTDQKLILSGKWQKRDQRLPGALVFYQGGKNDQNISDEDYSIRADYQWSKNNLYGRVLVNGAEDRTLYRDNNFLNEDGYLEQKYNHQRVHVSTSLAAYWSHWKVFAALDFRWQRLKGNHYAEQNPQRKELPLVLGAEWRKNGWFAKGHVLFQWIRNNASTQTGINPYLSVGKQWDDFQIKALYKNTLRLPSFYEQYYGQFTANKIIPEKAHQISLNMLYSNRFFDEHLFFKSQLSLFYNNVTDKIISRPTKDLFVWSVQNYGQVNTYGTTFDAFVSLKKNNHAIELSGNYTLQYVLDKTDPEGLNFNNQVPYTPYNLISGALKYQWKGLYLSVQYHYNGFRYAWKENHWSNVLNAFNTYDASLGYQWAVNEKHEFNFKVSVRNFTDTQYEVIRSYPMPGANMQISIQYEIH